MNALEKFEKANLIAFESLAEIQTQKNELELQEKKIKEIILAGMQDNGIDSIDNDIVRINLIPESESVAIDTKALRTKDPDLYRELMEKYNRRTKKSAHVRITVK